jgi:hypothetical protein
MQNINISLTDGISIVAQIMTILMIYVTYKTLRANHDRARREFAVRLMVDWVLQTKRYNRGAMYLVDKLTIHQCDSIFEMEPLQIDVRHEKLLSIALLEMAEIITITKDSDGMHIILDKKECIFLRNSIIYELNLLESIFSAYVNRVADLEIINQQFESMIVNESGRILLHDFILAAGGSKSYPALLKFANEIIAKRKSFNNNSRKDTA